MSTKKAKKVAVRTPKVGAVARVVAAPAVSELETLRRVDLLTGDLARGASEYELRKRIEEFPGADADSLLRRVMDHLLSHSRSAQSDAARFGFVVEAAGAIHRAALEEGDFKVALDAVKFLSGLSSPEIEDADDQGRSAEAGEVAG